MQKKYLERIVVIDDTIVFLHKAQSLWQGDTRIADALSRLSAIAATLHAADAAFVEGYTVGDTEAQQAAQLKAIAAVMRLTDEVGSWALRQNLPALLRMVKCEVSDIRKMRHADGITKLNQLYKACQAEAANIPDCSLKAEDFQNARACIDHYVGIKTDKAQKLNARVSVSESVPDLLSSAVPVQQELDLLVRRFALEQPEFFKQYKVTRKARHTGGPKAVRKKPESPTETKDAAKTKAKDGRKAGPGDKTKQASKADAITNDVKAATASEPATNPPATTGPDSPLPDAPSEADTTQAT